LNATGKIFVIGDSHIGLSDGAEVRVNAWLDRLAALKPKALYLNGDLFHYLIAHAKFRTTSVERVMAKFREGKVRMLIATDVPPTRLDAAKAAARTFAAMVPRSTKIGLVTFSEYGTVLLAPSTDRTAFNEALERLQVQSATSVGGGILEAVRVLPGRQALLRERLDRLLNRAPERALPPNPLEPRPNPDELAPATIIIFSDGVSNFGPSPFEAAQVAREGRVRIFTVGVGVQGGAVMRIENQMVLVPFDSAGLERIAQVTDGRYVPSTNEEELRRIYQQLGRMIGWERTRMEVSFLLLGLAGLVLVGGGAMSMAWFRRVP